MELINLFCMLRIQPGVCLACDYKASKVMLPSFPHSRQPRGTHPEFLGNAVQPKRRKPSENRNEYDTNDGPYLEPIRGVAGMRTSVARNIGGQNHSVNCDSRMPHSHTTLAPFDCQICFTAGVRRLRHVIIAPYHQRHSEKGCRDSCVNHSHVYHSPRCPICTATPDIYAACSQLPACGCKPSTSCTAVGDGAHKDTCCLLTLFCTRVPLVCHVEKWRHRRIENARY